MKRLILAATAALLSIPAASLAQTAPPPPPPPSPVFEAPQPLIYSGNGANDVLGDIHRQNMTDSARQVVQNTSPARLDRAERASALINAGDCPGAHALALQERDRRLARRIAEVCEIEN